HGRCRCPGRIDPLVSDRGCAFPAILLARNGNWIANGFASRPDEIEAPVPKTDNNIPGFETRVEAHYLTAAGAYFVAPAPVPEQLRARGRHLQGACKRPHETRLNCPGAERHSHALRFRAAAG